jgi:DNA-binding transcriptional regulator YdaS (Cro superfamily)
MTLSEYIKARRGNATKIALALGISLSYLSQMAAGTVSISPERCVRIWQITDGAVTRRDLRPADWWLIWPELVNPEFPVPAESAAEASNA